MANHPNGKVQFYSQEQENALLELRSLKPYKRREGIAQLAKQWKRTPIALQAKYYDIVRALKKTSNKNKKTHLLAKATTKPEVNFFFSFKKWAITITESEDGIEVSLK